MVVSTLFWLFSQVCFGGFLRSVLAVFSGRFALFGLFSQVGFGGLLWLLLMFFPGWFWRFSQVGFAGILCFWVVASDWRRLWLFPPSWFWWPPLVEFGGFLKLAWLSSQVGVGCFLGFVLWMAFSGWL